jgi:hypothetical protein
MALVEFVPYSIETDAHALHLKNLANIARLNYLRHIRIPCSERFVLETKDFVFDKSHVGYVMFKSCDRTITGTKSCQKLYLELVKIVHPDKCAEKWASKMFIYVQKFANDFEKLTEIMAHWKIHKTFADSKWISDLSDSKSMFEQDPELQIQQLENSLWYIWCVSSSPYHKIFHELFVHPDQIRQVQENYKEKILELEHKLRMSELDKSSLKDDIVLLKMQLSAKEPLSAKE